MHLRTFAAAFLVVALLAGCARSTRTPYPVDASVSTSPTLSPAADPRGTPNPPPPITPTPLPTAASDPVLTLVDTTADHYPVDLKGRVFSVRFSSPDELVLGRVGMPERLTFEGPTHLLGIDGDRITTATQTIAGWSLGAWSFTNGDRLAGPIEVSSSYTPEQTAGSGVVLSTAGSSDLRGLSWVSMNDGTSRTLVKPKPADPSRSEELAFAISADGHLLATSVCVTGTDSVGDCSDASVVDVSTGRLIDSVVADGGQVVGISSAGLLLYWETRAEMRNLAGEIIWTTKPFGNDGALWALQPLDAKSVLALLYSYDNGGRTRVLVMDARTGQTRSSAVWGAGPPAAVDIGLSTAGRVAVTPSNRSTCFTDNDTCDPGEDANLDLDTINLATGAITQHAIRIAIAP